MPFDVPLLLVKSEKTNIKSSSKKINMITIAIILFAVLATNSMFIINFFKRQAFLIALKYRPVGDCYPQPRLIAVTYFPIIKL